MMKSLKIQLKSALIEFNSEKARDILFSLKSKNEELVPKVIEEVLSEIGVEWEKGELALSHVYMSGSICEKIVEELFPQNYLAYNDYPKIGIVTFIDHHSLGKNIVLSVLRSVGIPVIDLGQGLSIQSLIDNIKKERIEILLISVLMLPSALKIKNLREELRKINYDIKILVGGAPFNFDKSLWKIVDADAMGCSPSDAVSVISNWLK
jgi:methanogenic corrinoid protein MtbC1